MFYVKSQNAAIVLRNRSTGATFEAFEVLPQTEAVLRAHGALIRSFPARAVFVPKKTLNNVSFLEDLGTAIHKLSVEELRLATETTKKGADVVTEERQTVHSRMVTEWLIGGVLSRPVIVHFLRWLLRIPSTSPKEVFQVRYGIY